MNSMPGRHLLSFPMQDMFPELEAFWRFHQFQDSARCFSAQGKKKKGEETRGKCKLCRGQQDLRKAEVVYPARRSHSIGT
jgi:hypothetical protein